MRRVTLLDQILAPGGLRVVFQPILHLLGGAWFLDGLEALTRGPRGTNVETADVLFEYVRRKREESRVDRACVAGVFEAARGLPDAPNFSVNVHASTLGRDRDFVAFVAESAAQQGIVLSRVTIEVVEHAPSWDSPSFLLALEALRSLGVRIALDDIGLGHSNYRMILECRPDIFKIDRYLVDGAGTDFHRQATLRSIASLAESFGGRTVAEGVDNLVDLSAVISTGISLVQGYLLGKPMTAEALCAADRTWGNPLETHVRGVAAGLAVA